MLRLSLGAWSPTTAYPWKKLCAGQRPPAKGPDATTAASLSLAASGDLPSIGKGKWLRDIRLWQTRPHWMAVGPDAKALLWCDSRDRGPGQSAPSRDCAAGIPTRSENGH